VLPFALLAALLLGGCVLRPGGNASGLTYNLPTTLTVKAGQALPGADIVYQEMSGDSAQLLIKGQRAVKRRGDSVSWKGSPLDGVTVDMALRVVHFTEQELRLAGTVKVVIEGVEPQQGVVRTTSKLQFSGPVAHSVSKGARIPGTTFTFIGQSEDGAELGGLNEYPFRKAGDSILWEGQLRPRVYLRLDVRAVQFDDRGLRVAGLATLWLGE
jgi:hypothetical protein